MTTYLRTTHTEARITRNGTKRRYRQVTEWHMDISVPDACRWITEECMEVRDIRVLPPFRDPRFN